MIKMQKTLIYSFRNENGAKFKLYRKIENMDVWQVYTDRMVFSGTQTGAIEFLKSKGIGNTLQENLVEEVVNKPAEEVLTEALEVAEEVVVEAITESEPELEVVAVLEAAPVIEEDREKEAQIRHSQEQFAQIAALEAQIEELKKEAE